MAMSTVAPRREKTTRFRRAPRDRSSRILFDLAGAERRMGGVSSALWRALYVRDPEGHLRANPAWESANATTRRRAIESLVRLRNSAQFVFRRANGAINLLSVNDAERLRRELEGLLAAGPVDPFTRAKQHEHAVKERQSSFRWWKSLKLDLSFAKRRVSQPSDANWSRQRRVGS